MYGHFSSFLVQSEALYSEAETARGKLQTGQVALAQATSASGTESAAATFLALFESELSRTAFFVESQEKSQELSAKALLNSIEDLVTGKERLSKEVLNTQRVKAQAQVDSCIHLQRFVVKSAEILTQLAAYADATLKTTCRLSLERQTSWNTGADNSSIIVVLSDMYGIIRTAEAQRDTGVDNSSISVVLSDMYGTIRTAEAKRESNGQKWEAPSSFERCTKKFWVEESRLKELLLGALVEAPLLVYGRQGRLSTKADHTKVEGNKLWDTFATSITSVYFDSVGMDLYAGRIARQEGATLLRARWYGPKPSGNEHVFLELKTHHEKWINTKSVKERVTIREKDMAMFLAEVKWVPADARAVVIKATPNMKEEAQVKAVDLLLRMHKLLIKYKLRPCVRSTYMRAAFQCSTSNSLRLTLDRHITLIDESKSPKGMWCLPDNVTINENMVTRVPYSVFEVKLAGSEMPPSLESMIDSGTIVEAEKFSKFLTGAAAFNANTISMLPYWAEHPAFAPLFGGGPQSAMPSQPVFPDSIHQKATHQEPLRRRSTEQPCQVVERRTSSTLQKPAFMVPAKPSQNGFLATILSRFRGEGEAGNVVAPKRRARVEPKSFFANERTFIQWISAALLLVTISAVLLSVDAAGGNDAFLPVELILNYGSITIVIYGLFVFYRRLHLLDTGKPYGYIDKVGPAVLSLFILVGVTSLLLFLKDGTSTTSTSLSLRGTRVMVDVEKCMMHDVVGVSNLELQPSDVLVDAGRDLLIVPSLSTIRGIKRNGVSDARVLVDIPRADIEDLAFVGDKIYAISENESQFSELIALQWSPSDNSRLEIVQRWTLEVPRAEGLAYIPGNSGRPGQLFVAGDNGASAGSDRGTISIIDDYELSADQTEPLTGRLANAKLINNGLLDSKIGALHYFEGVMYILHDNAGVVRAWDMDQGTLLSEWKLPAAPVGFEQQWEGMALERSTVGPKDDEGVSASADTSTSTAETERDGSLLLHLTLDSPPQVWTLSVEQGDARGEIISPECAYN